MYLMVKNFFGKKFDGKENLFWRNKIIYRKLNFFFFNQELGTRCSSWLHPTHGPLVELYSEDKVVIEMHFTFTLILRATQ